MNLEVVGRHALLFDDDAMATFVNSADALVDWNSLEVDRYDVRHLLSGPPPPRKRRSPPSVESDLDYERYLDLPSASDEQHQQQPDSSISLPSEGAGGFHTVGYAYEASGESTDHKDMNAESEESRFTPPFPVPENLIHNLPPTEKVHLIIARTAKFVSDHGGQSEVVLRVKQGDNPTFGFLMPDHHLHAYFRFLIDHQELLSATNSNQEVKNITLEQNESGAMGNGALSLLSSLYGTEEDDENAQQSAKNDEQKPPGVTDALQKVSQEAGKKVISPVVPAEKDLSKDLRSKEKVPSKRSLNQGAGMVGISKRVKIATEASSKQFAVGTMGKLQASDVIEMPKPEAIILEPPSDIKNLIDKIVEFVQRNGKEVETVLCEQDVKHGRFPFLVSSNQYHPYYLKMLQKTQESSATEKSSPEKDYSVKHGKKSALKKGEALSTESDEFPFDANRKEKFTMVLGKSKGLVQLQTSKASEAPTEVGMDTTAIAAILQAATRGAKLPSSMILSKSSVNGSSQNVDSQVSSTNMSWPQNSAQNQDLDELRNPSVPSAKNIAKTAALAAASEADSSEASMTKEQKLKTERLKRAKMFAAMIKGGGAAIKTELIRGNSEERAVSGASGLVRGFSVERPEYVERPESGASVLVGEVGVQAVKEREGSSIPPDVETSEETEKFEMRVYDDEDKERRSKRSYRSKSKKNAGGDNEVSAYRKSSHKQRSHGSDESAGDEVEEHSRKKRGKHDDEYVDENDGRAHSRKKHRFHRYDDVDEDGDKAHSRKKHRSHRSLHDSKERHGHGKEHYSKHHSHKDRHRHHSSDDNEHHRHRSSKKASKDRQSHEDSALEEGENSSRLTNQSKPGGRPSEAIREASAEHSASHPEETTAPVAADIPDELRAKVRAMLLANL